MRNNEKWLQAFIKCIVYFKFCSIRMWTNNNANPYQNPNANPNEYPNSNRYSCPNANPCAYDNANSHPSHGDTHCQ